MKYPLKLIEWHDAYSGDHSWFHSDHLPAEYRPHKVSTLGFEVQRTDQHVTLAMSCTENGMLCDLFTIPLGMIVREQTFRRRSLSEELQK